MRLRPNGQPTRRGFALRAAAGLAISLGLAVAPVTVAQAHTITTIHSATTRVDESPSSHLVPSVVGWNAVTAASVLRSLGFVVVFKAPAGSPVSVPAKWSVTKQSIAAKTKAPAGTRITLTVVKTATVISTGTSTFYAQDYGIFSPLTRSGTGTQVISLPANATAAIVTSSYSGVGAFTIVELGASNVATDRNVVNTLGSYKGSNAIGLSAVKVKTTALRVTGTGSWQVSISPISTAPVVSLPASGSGDYVYLYSGPSAIWSISSPGPTAFMLNQISSSSFPNLAVNENGNWSGSVALQPGPSVIEIHSNGPWSIN